MKDTKKKKILKEDELIDQAVAQQTALASPAIAPAASPVAPAAPQAAVNPMNPLVPPAPGMIPTGWMYPQQGAAAVAAETGDVNLAATAPDAAVPIAPAGSEAMGDDVGLSDEEKEVLEEYRKWKSKRAKMNELKKKLGGNLKEEELEELPPAMPTEVDLVEPPVEGDDADPEIEVDLDGEEEFDDELDEEESVVDELEDIVVDINGLFADLGGDLDEVLVSDDEVDEELADEELDDVDDLEAELEGDFGDELDDDEAEEPSEEELLEARKKVIAERIAAFKERKVVNPLEPKVKYPAGSEPKKDAVKETVDKIARRREMIAELRKRKALAESDAENADPDALDKEIDYESINAVVDQLGESKIKKSKQQAMDKKFVERYQEKKGLNFRELLERGLLG